MIQPDAIKNRLKFVFVRLCLFSAVPADILILRVSRIRMSQVQSPSGTATFFREDCHEIF